MKKAGLIFGAVAFVVVMLCIPLELLVGGAAGFFAGIFDKPSEKSVAVKSGALAGLLASIGQVIGFLVSVTVTYFVNGRSWGLGGGLALGSLVIAMISFLSVLLMTGTGALGGLIWHRFNSGNASEPPAVKQNEGSGTSS